MSRKATVSDGYRALRSRVLLAMREDLKDQEFNALALDIHAFQRWHNRPYARWCATLPTPGTWREIPAVPQAMFKRFRLSCFPPRLTPLTFRTSGTTGETCGEHHFPDASLYNASVLRGWSRLGLPALPSLFLSQHPAHATDSSLATMFGFFAKNAVKRAAFDLHADAEKIRRLAVHGPCAIFGTALAFLALFERMGRERVRLPRGSFAFETGGYKGSGRDIPKERLYGMFREFLGLPANAVWNEYGMTELSSQAHTRGLGGPHRTPPWLRALVIDPETGDEVPVGRSGVLRMFDLANVSSVLAVQTADIAVRLGDGFDLLGRDPAALPRGCSRPVDELLGAVSGNRVFSPHGLAQRRKDAKTSTAAGSHCAIAPLREPAPPALNTAQRARALARAASAFPFLGKVTARGLLALVASELGHAAALDCFVPLGRRHARAVAPQRILHVFSGNTPAAALQTILRGLLLGSENFCKLPRGGIPEAAQLLSRLPHALAQRVHFSGELRDDWLAAADAAVIFGRDGTVDFIRARLRPGIPVAAYGHMMSHAAVFRDPRGRSITGLVRDIAAFDQHGCLSPHAVFVAGDDATLRSHAAQLAQALARHEERSPRGPLTVSEANSIRTLREETAFRAANGEPLEVFASADTAWTVIVDGTDAAPVSPGNRVVFVKPLRIMRQSLATQRGHLSTCGIWPVNAENRDAVVALGFTRICPIGKMQQPPLDWHHDGQRVLAPLVKWVDCER